MGYKGGVVKFIDELLRRPLLWWFCLLHLNELPLRHLVAEIDGTSSGMCSSEGESMKAIQGCETQPIVNFPTRYQWGSSVALQTDPCYRRGDRLLPTRYDQPELAIAKA